LAKEKKETMKTSAVIPAYNAEKHIARAIDSVLAQTRPADEIIVVDDGSIDKTPDVVRSFGDKVIFIQQENAGASAARNTGINAASGDWIAFLDADDEWLPSRLELQFKHLNNYPDLVWITGNYKRCCCDRHHCQYESGIGAGEQFMDDNGTIDYFKAYLENTAGHMDTKLIKKTVLHEAGLLGS
jgi:glycosyltransferase involved in cell wall biosynthesis